MNIMQLDEIISFLKTDTVNVIFSDVGLEFLSLKPAEGARMINLNLAGEEESPLAKLVLKETVNFFETGRHQMPLDFTAFTPFQQSVFETVRAVERGKVVTYKDIAGRLGKPGAAQAVGSAVAKNPVAYFLPTHRVLPVRGIGICRSGVGHLRDRLLELEGHDLAKLRGNYVCTRNKCIYD